MGSLHKALFFILRKELLKYIVYDDIINGIHFLSYFDKSNHATGSCKPHEKVYSIY